MILEHGQREEFRKCVLETMPAIPRVGDFYQYGTTVYEVVRCVDGILTLENTCSRESMMSTGIWGIYNNILEGTMVKINIETQTWETGFMRWLEFPEEGTRNELKAAMFAHLFTGICSICGAVHITEHEDEQWVGCSNCVTPVVFTP